MVCPKRWRCPIVAGLALGVLLRNDVDFFLAGRVEFLQWFPRREKSLAGVLLSVHSRRGAKLESHVPVK